jgi:molybdopterin-containing oxidoreductase family iron-sulfur binding subunit
MENVLCIQMTQATILNAKKRRSSWWRIQTACSNACSNGAMNGDVNDKESEITKLAEDERMYHF